MADKVSIVTDELRAQAERINALVNRIEEFRMLIIRGTNRMDDALVGGNSVNAEEKGRCLSIKVRTFRENLSIGAQVALKCAASYENADKVLRDLLGESLPKEIIESPVSSQTVEMGFAEKVDRLKNTDGFRQGDYWGNGSRYQGDYKGYYINAWSCCAKAKQMQIEVTGKLGERTGITDASQIQPGDVIHYYYPGTYWYDGKEYPNEHWVFVTAVNGNTISVGEGNAWDGQNSERVNYRDMDISQFNNIESIYR